jgi:predicted nuclease of predicted toxin-antitoxin system
MLSLLLDEQISPEIAKQIESKRKDIPIQSIHTWHEGYYLGMSDEIILKNAAIEGLTLITYDQKTIPLILSEWGTASFNHAGVIFIDYRSIAPNNFGTLVKAIIWLFDTQSQESWNNRIVYLQPAK